MKIVMDLITKITNVVTKIFLAGKKWRVVRKITGYFETVIPNELENCKKKNSSGGKKQWSIVRKGATN